MIRNHREHKEHKERGDGGSVWDVGCEFVCWCVRVLVRSWGKIVGRRT